MSLRLRLTLLYSTLMGAILLVISASVTLVINRVLLQQVDETLEKSQAIVFTKMKEDNLGRVVADLSSNDMGYDVYMQIWGLGGDLQDNYRLLNNFTTAPFDTSGLHQDSPEYRDFVGPDWHIRVLSIPLEQEGKRLGTLQIASRLDIVDAAQDDLTEILSIIWIVAVLFSGIAVWVTMGQTLKPLAAITETVEQINRADDLSRRIPYNGPEDDEIGSMVGSFNQTLERLEALFTSQQRLLADVSHELRTPLTVIKGNVDLMRRMKSLDQEFSCQHRPGSGSPDTPGWRTAAPRPGGDRKAGSCHGQS